MSGQRTMINPSRLGRRIELSWPMIKVKPNHLGSKVEKYWLEQRLYELGWVKGQEESSLIKDQVKMACAEGRAKSIGTNNQIDSNRVEGQAD